MDKYSTEQRVQIVKLYQNNKSIIQTQRAYRRYYGVRDAPGEFGNRSLIKRFKKHGRVHDRLRSGRPRTARTEGKTEQIRESIEENPGTSIRKRSTQLGMSQSSLQWISRNFKLFPYRVQLVQQLKPQDYEQRLQYAIRIQELSRNDPNFTYKLIFSDEAHFRLAGLVNKQNCRIWGSENPRSIHQRELHPIKCTVWCGVTKIKLVVLISLKMIVETPSL